MSACEASAEVYASMLVRSMKERLPGVHIDAVGGESLSESGADVVESAQGFGVMGLAEGLGTIRAHMQMLSRLRRRFARGLYDLAILVDYPGFHLKVAAAAAANNVPVLYYVAPQLWAWGSWRVRAIRKHVRQMAVVLPFEEEFFRSRGVVADFVGHPLLDRAINQTADNARATLHLPGGISVLGLLPGSRPSEINRLWPTFRDAAKRLSQSIPKLRVLVAAMNGIEYPGAPEFQFCSENSAALLAASDAVLCKSGTATLEAALSGTPMVIAYRMHPMTFWVAKRAVRLPHVGLVNLVAGREVCPEFLQSHATPHSLAMAVGPLLEQSCDAASRQREAFAEIRAKLGGPGASERVADIAARMVA